MISVGPTCQVPGCMCPPWKDRLCSGHWRLSHMFGHTPEPHQPDWHILPSTSPAFDRELHQWLAGNP